MDERVKHLTEAQWCDALVAHLNARHITYKGYKPSMAVWFSNNEVGVNFQQGNHRHARRFQRRETVAATAELIAQELA